MDSNSTGRLLSFPMLGTVAVPGALLMAAALFQGPWGSPPPLENTRPLATATAISELAAPAPLNAVYSRIWEDPLAAAEAHAKTVADANEKNREVAGEENPRDTDAEKKTPEFLLRSYFSKRLHEFSQGSRKLLLMPVFVPGSPYSEDAETRRRMRYSVVSALDRAGFRLEYPTRTTYVTVKLQCRHAGVKGGQMDTREIVVPIKLYTPLNAATKYSAVMVCWMNEERLGADPIDVINQFAESLFGGETPNESEGANSARFQVAIVGPTNSDVYENMRESKHAVPFLADTQCPLVINVRSTADKAREQAVQQDVLVFKDIVSVDSDLATGIVHELGLRGISGDSNDRVVLITESDTLYGREFPELFRNAFRKSRVAKQDASPSKTNSAAAGNATSEPAATGPAATGPAATSVEVIHYLRGLDGRTFQADTKNASALDLPEGKSQYDYIRRLRERIDRLRVDSKRNGNGTIRAFGVVGSDVHDKLLLVRALRSYFPEACFFTTDLDAIYSHPQEFQHTRNLIVASHFGLTLADDLQGSIPPFRDAYQTSTFLGVLYAVGDEKATKRINARDKLKAAPGAADAAPTIFEIGRSGAYQLNKYDDDLHPTPRKSESQLAFGSVTAILVLIALIGFQFKAPRSVVLPVKEVNNCGLTGRLKPFWDSLLRRRQQADDDGVKKKGLLNALPTGLTEYLSKFDLETTVRVTLAISLLPLFAFLISWVNQKLEPEPLLLTEGISSWPSFFLMIVAFLQGSFFLLRHYYHSAFQKFASKISTIAIGKQDATLGDLPFWERFQNTFLFLWKSIDHEGRLPIKTLMQEFVYKSSSKVIAVRVLCITIWYAAYAVWAWSYLGLESTGNRDLQLRVCHSAITILTLAFAVIGSFTVIDASQLARLTIKRLGNGTKGWSDHCHDESGQMFNNPVAAEAIKSVRIMAEVSGKALSMLWEYFILLFLIFASYYPFFEFYAIPWATLAILAPPFLGVMISLTLLRQEAQRGRDRILRRLDERAVKKTEKDAMPPVCKETRALVATESGGAFRPISEDPLVRSLSIPFGGTTSLIALEQVFRSLYN